MLRSYEAIRPCPGCERPETVTVALARPGEITYCCHACGLSWAWEPGHSQACKDTPRWAAACVCHGWALVLFDVPACERR